MDLIATSLVCGIMLALKTKVLINITQFYRTPRVDEGSGSVDEMVRLAGSQTSYSRLHVIEVSTLKLLMNCTGSWQLYIFMFNGKNRIFSFR